jgi:hypothetical protein
MLFYSWPAPNCDMSVQPRVGGVSSRRVAFLQSKLRSMYFRVQGAGSAAAVAVWRDAATLGADCWHLSCLLALTAAHTGRWWDARSGKRPAAAAFCLDVVFMRARMERSPAG